MLQGDNVSIDKQDCRDSRVSKIREPVVTEWKGTHAHVFPVEIFSLLRTVFVAKLLQLL